MASTATLSRLRGRRIDAAPLPGIRATCAYAPQRAWAGDTELAPCLARDQPRPRLVALAQRDVSPTMLQSPMFVFCHIVPSYERCCAQKSRNQLHLLD